jgi:hypothetical protein
MSDFCWNSLLRTTLGRDIRDADGWISEWRCFLAGVAPSAFQGRRKPDTLELGVAGRAGLCRRIGGGHHAAARGFGG